MKKLFLSLAITLLITQAAGAQKMETDYMGVPAHPNAIKPSIFVYEAKPGETITDEILVKNTSDKESTLFIYGVDSTLSKQGSTAFKKRGMEMKELGTWLTFTEQEFTFEPQEVKTIPFTVSIPLDAEKKDYIGGIALEKFYAANEGSSVNHAVRIIQNVELKITDTPKEIPLLTVSTFEVKPFFWVTVAIAGGCFAYLIYSSRKKKHAQKN